MHPFLQSPLGISLFEAGRVIQRDDFPSVDEIVESARELYRARRDDQSDHEPASSDLVEVFGSPRTLDVLFGSCTEWFKDKLGNWIMDRLRGGRGGHTMLRFEGVGLVLVEPSACLIQFEAPPDNLLLMIDVVDIRSHGPHRFIGQPSRHLIYDIGGLVD